MTALLAYENPVDSLDAYPATLPIELALQVASVREICGGYGITREQMAELVHNPAFVADLERARAMVRKEGMSFRLKAQLQADHLLQTSWQMIHDAATPAAVRADLLKFTIKAAGLDASKDQGSISPGAGLMIQINM